MFAPNLPFFGIPKIMLPSHKFHIILLYIIILSQTHTKSKYFFGYNTKKIKERFSIEYADVEDYMYSEAK